MAIVGFLGPYQAGQFNKSPTLKDLFYDVHDCGQVCPSEWRWQPRREAADSLEPEFQVAMSQLMRVLGTELRSSAREISALSPCAIAPGSYQIPL